MKGRKLLFGLLFLIAAGAASVLLFTNGQQPENVQEGKPFHHEKGIRAALAYYNFIKMDPATGEIRQEAFEAAFKGSQMAPVSKALNLDWQEMGPNNVGGRVRAILIDNEDNTNKKMYAGGVSGGLWRSVTAGQSWEQIPLSDNIAVSSIAQAPNHTIFVGTGEGLADPVRYNYNSGMFGGGIYRSIDSVTFELLSGTTTWKSVNRIAVDKNGIVYAATNSGLFVSEDNGDSWTRVGTIGDFHDVRIHHDDTKVYATKKGRLMIGDKNGISNSTLPYSGISRTEIAISPSNKDIIYAVLVNSNPSGSMNSIQRSTDGGATWTQIATFSAQSMPLFGEDRNAEGEGQGDYDISLMVHLTNPDRVFVGGISMWEGNFVANGLPFSWQQISSTTENFTSGPNPQYVHADQHALTQVPGVPNSFYLGTDGGIFKTTNGGSTFTPLNKNFNVTQYYAVAPHPAGGAAGGTQDNSTPWVNNGMNNNPLEAKVLYSGDGGWTSFCPLNHDFVIATSQFGNLGRSNDKGDNWQMPSKRTNSAELTNSEPNFFSTAMLEVIDPYTPNSPKNGVDDASAFVTPHLMWYTTNYPNNIDSCLFIADTTYAIGDKIQVRSKFNSGYPFDYTISQAMATGDSIVVADKIQSRFFFGAIGGVYMTKQAMYYGKTTPSWYKIADLGDADVVFTMALSKDGDDLWFSVASQKGNANTNTKLYRVSNILAGQDSSGLQFDSPTKVTEVTMVKDFDAVITSIAVDPEDNNRVVVTLGGYSSSYDHIWYSDNATDATPTFVGKQGDLSATLPVYSSLIPIFHSNTLLVGTEFGMFATENLMSANPTYTSVNGGIDDPVPVFMLRQQTYDLPYVEHMIYDNGSPVITGYPGVYNYGTIYAATHGRGIFKSEMYTSINNDEIRADVKKASLKVYPNPVQDMLNIELDLPTSENVVVNVYSINGKLVKRFDIKKQVKGISTVQFDLGDLTDGVYFVQMQTPTQQATSKIIVR